MPLTRRGAASVGVLVFALCATLADLAWANGQEFFAAPMGNVDLVYTGRVRDTNGRFLPRATMVIWSEEAALTFPSITDDYGHYRSPDVGANIKEVTSAPPNPKELKAACSLPGYEQTRPIVFPKKAKGTVELNCTLRKAGSETTESHEAESRPTPGLFWLVPAAMVIVVIGAAVRR
jgi:hypothetical protein